jgi:uncharacterized protein (UPF0297 family)
MDDDRYKRKRETLSFDPAAIRKARHTRQQMGALTRDDIQQSAADAIERIRKASREPESK